MINSLRTLTPYNHEYSYEISSPSTTAEPLHKPGRHICSSLHVPLVDYVSRHDCRTAALCISKAAIRNRYNCNVQVRESDKCDDMTLLLSVWLDAALYHAQHQLLSGSQAFPLFSHHRLIGLVLDEAGLLLNVEVRFEGEDISAGVCASVCGCAVSTVKVVLLQLE